MTGDLFVVVSVAPERISRIVSQLRPFTSNYLFFSGIYSFMGSVSHTRVKLVIIDDSDGCIDITEAVQEIRGNTAFDNTIIIVIVGDGGSERGVEALNAGANDYLPFSLVGKELTARVRMRLSVYEAPPSGCGLEDIYPIEDRYLLKSALHHIKDGISSIKTVGDLSSHVGRPQKDINRVFLAQFGKTAFEYLRDYRMSVAKEMLSQTRFSITHIADQVGYSSVANFSTAFKSIVGVSPRSYRGQFLSSK